MPSSKFEHSQVFIIETDNENPANAIEKGKAISGIRGEIEFTLEKIEGKRWRVTFAADRYCNFRRVFSRFLGITVVNDKL
jgi:hypothetical protein